MSSDFNTVKEKTIKNIKKHTVFIFCDDSESCDLIITLSRYYDVIVSNCSNEDFDAQFERIPDLFLFIVSDLKKMTKIVESRSDIFFNPLSVMWWPQKRTISDIDLIQCSLKGIDHVPITRFSNQVWLAKIKGRLKANSTSQGYYQRDMISEAASAKPVLNNLELVDEIIDYLGKNNLNEEFSIEKMGVDLGMSRTKFFNKVKSITGQSPSRLVMNYRLRKATNLLDNNRSNISEIAFEVGFSSTAYFTKCFKDLHGINPSQYIKAKKGQTKHLSTVNIDPLKSSIAV